MKFRIPKNTMKKYNYFLLLIFMLLIYGCQVPEAVRVKEDLDLKKPEEKVLGFYHIVKEGESLSDISRRYNVNVGKIEEINQLPDKNKLDVGQMIYIPEDSEFYRSSPENFKDRFIWPVQGKVIALYSEDKEDYNPGIDIEVIGEDKIVAADEGSVTFVGEYVSKKDKRIILINHSGGFSSVYIFSGKILVKEGEYVFKGQPIFESTHDETDRILSFEIRRYHIPQNPYFFLNR